jgi:hypothetical protein
VWLRLQGDGNPALSLRNTGGTQWDILKALVEPLGTYYVMVEIID